MMTDLNSFLIYGTIASRSASILSFVALTFLAFFDLLTMALALLITSSYFCLVILALASFKSFSRLSRYSILFFLSTISVSFSAESVTFTGSGAGTQTFFGSSTFFLTGLFCPMKLKSMVFCTSTVHWKASKKTSSRFC